MTIGQISEECKQNGLVAIIKGGEFKGFKSEC